MLKRLASSMLIAAMLLTVGGSAAFAHNLSDPTTSAPAPSSPGNQTSPNPNEKLRSAMDHLVAEAKAGKLTRAERSQMQPARSNNLSTKTKVAIGVGIAIAVIAIIVIKHDRDSMISVF